MRKVGAYGVPLAITAALPLLLLPVFTRYLSPTDYGIFAMFQILVMVGAPLISLALQVAVRRAFFERENIDFSAYISTTLYLQAAAALLVGLGIFFLGDALEAVAKVPAYWLWAVFLIWVAQAPGSLVASLWQVKGITSSYSLWHISRTAFPLALALIFVVGLGMDWKGRALGPTVAWIVLLPVALIIVWRRHPFRAAFRHDYALRMLKFSLPIVPHALSTYLIMNTDRIIIVNIVGTAEAGIYAIGAQLASVIIIITQACALAWEPWFFARLKSGVEEDRKRVVFMFYVFTVGILLAAGAISLVFDKLIHIIVGKDFITAVAFIPLLSFAFAFRGMYSLLSVFALYHRKNLILTTMTSFLFLLNLVLNYGLIRANGPIGAAQATLLVYIVGVLIMWAHVFRFEKMPWLSVFRMPR